jgi:hypothetical protein
MFPIPIPVPAGDPAEVAELRARVLFLEHALAAALKRLAAAGIGIDSGAADEGAAREAVAEVGRLVAGGKAPEAARRYRELFGVTWDEAHTAVARWQAARSEELARRLWLKRWAEAHGGANPAPEQTGGA